MLIEKNTFSNLSGNSLVVDVFDPEAPRISPTLDAFDPDPNIVKDLEIILKQSTFTNANHFLHFLGNRFTKLILDANNFKNVKSLDF
jgi:hypothetical protein